MTVREMIGFDEAEIKTETEAAKNRVRKLMDDINEMPAGKAEKNCPYYKPEDEDDSERCENLLALFCKLDECPLTSSLALMANTVARILPDFSPV